jgi:hypothetical protein
MIKDNTAMGDLKNEHCKKKREFLNTGRLPRFLRSLTMTVTQDGHCEEARQGRRGNLCVQIAGRIIEQN